MATPRRIRLSPSGPFIVDATSGAPLQAGDGTPGLVWRSQGANPAAALIQFNGAALTELAPLTMAFVAPDGIPPGYHYDVEVNLWVDTNAAAVENGVLHLAVEIEETTHPGVWTPVQNNTGDVTYGYSIGAAEIVAQTQCIHFGNIDLDRTAAAALLLTGVRVRGYCVAAGGTPVPFYSGQLSNMRITQYVSE